MIRVCCTGEHTAGRPHATCHGRPHCAVLPQGPCHYGHRSGRLPRWYTSLSAHQGVLPSQGHQQCYGCVKCFFYSFVRLRKDSSVIYNLCIAGNTQQFCKCLLFLLTLLLTYSYILLFIYYFILTIYC